MSNQEMQRFSPMQGFILIDSHGGELILNGDEVNIKQGQFVAFPAEILHSV